MSRANTPLDGGFESTHKNLTNSLVGTDVQAQLSTSTDVSAAHDFFRNPGGAQSYLPQFSGFEVSATPVQGTGAETLAAKAMGAVPGAEGAFAKAMMPSGAEASLLKTPGLEASAFAGMQPGAAGPMDPLIQLILKMPGALGMMQDLFEFLGALFMHPLETMMHSLLDPSSWLSHATDALGELGSDHIVNMGLVPGDAPIFETLNGHHGSLFENLGKDANSLQFGPRDLNVNGLPEGKSPFEGSSQDMEFNFQNGTQLAFDNGSNQFQPSFGTPASQPVTLPSQTTPQDLYNQTMDQQGAMPVDQSTMQRGDLLNPGANQTPAGHEMTAQNTDAHAQTEGAIENPTQAYTVKHGDNLWDIAKDKLGNGQRWGEIYKMNTNVIGENPRLIMPGAELHLPGGAANETIAGAGAENYLVKSGDNLWNISKDHLGGGEHWPDVYHQNADVVGSNPDLIHPGQELKIDHSQIAHHDVGAHHTAHHGGGHGHHGGGHHGGAHGAQHQVAHNNHSAGHQGNHAASHNQSASHGTQSAQANTGNAAGKTVADAKPDTQAAAPAQAQTDYASGSATPATSATGAVGLKTTQTMGSLESQT